MFDRLRANTQKYLELSDNAFDYFCSLLETKSFKKKDFLLKQGEIGHFEAYILNGCIIEYHQSEKKDKIVLNFLTEDWWVSDIPGMATGERSNVNLQALEDTDVLMISRDNKEKLYHEFPSIERLFRIMSMVKIGAMQIRTIANLSQTADEKYADLTQKYPDLEQRVPQYLIASYLGISPEFLSKIRRKVHRL